jgi:hypothetical protein
MVRPFSSDEQRGAQAAEWLKQKTNVPNDSIRKAVNLLINSEE